MAGAATAPMVTLGVAVADAVEAADAPALEQALREAAIPAAIVGRVRAEAHPPILVL